MGLFFDIVTFCFYLFVCIIQGGLYIFLPVVILGYILGLLIKHDQFSFYYKRVLIGLFIIFLTFVITKYALYRFNSNYDPAEGFAEGWFEYMN